MHCKCEITFFTIQTRHYVFQITTFYLNAALHKDSRWFAKNVPGFCMNLFLPPNGKELAVGLPASGSSDN